MSINGDQGKYRNLPSETAEELYENAPCGYVSFAGDGTIVMINGTMLSWLGYEREEVLFVRKFQSLLNIGGRIYFETHFFPLIRIQGFVKEVNFDFVRKDKSALPILLNVNEVSGGEGDMKVYRATVFDISDRKKYEKELLNARKKAEVAASNKAEFLATISHEIRTPLNAIIGISNLIQHTPLNEQQKEYALILKSASDSLLGLVNDILDFSKIEKGKVKLEEKVFSVQDVAHSVVNTQRVRAAEKGIDLLVKLDEELPDYFAGDPLKLNQILTNLIGNAIKFTKKGFVKLEITTTGRDDEKVNLQFKVIDTGIGIPQDRLDSIFEEFTQGSYEVNATYGGTGLGLTISQKLLHLHGSNLEVASKVGEGSEFSFQLSYRISSKPPVKDVIDLSHSEKNILSDLRILVVDDTPFNVVITTEFLKIWGIDFDTAGDGLQAVELARHHQYDLVLMDLQMPEMDGFTATEAIRQLNLTKQPGIVALSASAREDLSAKLKLSGFDDYLPKPFNPEDLYKVILTHTSNLNKEGNLNLQLETRGEGNKQMDEPGIKINSTMPFDLSYYEQIVIKNGAPIEEVVEITISSFEEFRAQFSSAIEKHDLNAFSRLVHKSKMPLHYIQAKRLEKVILGVNQLMEESFPSKLLLEERLKVLNTEFDLVINGLKSFISQGSANEE